MRSTSSRLVRSASRSRESEASGETVRGVWRSELAQYLERLMPRISARLIVLTAIVLGGLTSGAADASVGRVWAVNDGEKIARDDLDNPNRASNSAWDGRTIKLFGAR